jgi:hypothetical protein
VAATRPHQLLLVLLVLVLLLRLLLDDVTG